MRGFNLDQIELLAYAALPMTGEDPGKVDSAWLGTDAGVALARALDPRTVLAVVDEIRGLLQELGYAADEVHRLADPGAGR